MKALDACAADATNGKSAPAAWAAGVAANCKTIVDAIAERRPSEPPGTQDTTFIDRATRPSTIPTIKGY